MSESSFKSGPETSKRLMILVRWSTPYQSRLQWNTNVLLASYVLLPTQRILQKCLLLLGGTWRIYIKCPSFKQASTAVVNLLYLAERPPHRHSSPSVLEKRLICVIKFVHHEHIVCNSRHPRYNTWLSTTFRVGVVLQKWRACSLTFVWHAFQKAVFLRYVPTTRV